MNDQPNILWKSDQWLQHFFDHAYDLIHIVHEDGAVIYVNEAWSRRLQYKPEEIFGRPIEFFISEQDRPSYISHRQQVIAGAVKGNVIIFGLRSKSGQTIMVEGVVSLKSTTETPRYTIGIFRDITERIKQESHLKAVNKELQQKGQNLQQLLTFAPDAVVAIDQDSQITFWNLKAEQMFGWPAQEVMSKNLATTIIPPRYRDAHEAGMKRYLSTGEARVLNKTIDITAINKHGDEFFVSLTISNTFSQNSTTFIAFIRDTTEDKKMQRAIEEKSRQLERSNQSLEAFAYAASHDLKQPIRKVQIFADRLIRELQDRLNVEQKGYFDRIENAAKRMQTLIDDLLTYSKITLDDQFFLDVRLDDVLSEVIDDLDLEIQENLITITRDPLPVVKGNRGQLHQLFHNLVSNSIKYRSQDHLCEINLRSKPVSNEEAQTFFEGISGHCSYHLICIQDNGIGFAQTNAEKIFKVFTRLHTQEKYSGSGVGLSIALKVVENHNGFIKAESESGKSTTFYILLPNPAVKGGPLIS